MALIDKHVFDGEFRAVLDDDLLPDECVAVDHDGSYQVDRHVLWGVGVDGNNIQHHRGGRFLNPEGLHILVSEDDFITGENVHRGNDHKLHRGLPLSYDSPEDLKGNSFLGWFELKNVEVP